MVIKALIFDMDGTLVNSLSGIVQAMNRILLKAGFPTHSEKAYLGFVGAGIETLVTRSLPQNQRTPEQIFSSVLDLRREYSSTWRNSGSLYDQIPQLLDSLTASGLTMAILSNKPHDFTEQFTEYFLARWKFNPVQGAEIGKPKKPDPESALMIANNLNLSPSQIMIIGDSGIDMETACNAGIIPVGVSWGYRSVKELKTAGAKFIIDNPSDLLNLIH
ncbi:MAG: HAD family hydrolase [Candidatus Marinimicrobia bacterium]|nr:HAD family hydrolase [Candidatus Neomarinimicrobiota bacterium]